MRLGISSTAKNTPTKASKIPSSHQKILNEKTNSLQGLNRSLFLYSRRSSNIKNSNKNHQNYGQISMIKQSDEQAAEIMKQLSVSYLFAMCQTFQKVVKTQIDTILNKFLTLECKIAECQKKFNQIQIQLHKKSKEIASVIQENKILIHLNRDIELRMEQLRQKYTFSYQSIQNEWIGNKIQEFKQELSTYKLMSKQCQSCRQGIKERLRKQLNKFDQVDNKLKESASSQIIKNTLKQILQMLYGLQQREDLGLIGWKQKILENIDLKFEIMDLIRDKSPGLEADIARKAQLDKQRLK